MIYLVERYAPGLSSVDLRRALEPLSGATRQMRSEGTPVRYLGSTIVPDDEACFCQFEGASEDVVAEANRRAGLAFDRIVQAVTVTPASGSRREGANAGRAAAAARPGRSAHSSE